MNNLLKIAPTVLAAISAAAHASGPVIHGNVDVAVGAFRTAHIKSDVQHSSAVKSDVLSQSYIEFSDTEQIGNGISARASISQYLDPATGRYRINRLGAGEWSRTAYVSLADEHNTFTVGQTFSTLYVNSTSFSAFGRAPVASPTVRLVFGLDGIVRSDITWQQSATITHVNERYQLSAQASFSSTGTGTSYAVTAATSLGNSQFGIAYGDLKNQAAGGVPGGPSAADQKVLTLGAYTQLGDTSLYASYTETDGVFRAPNPTEGKAYELGARYSLTTSSNLVVAYGKSWKTTAATELLSAGWIQDLSARTNVYAIYTRQAKPTASEVGDSFALGVRHSF